KPAVHPGPVVIELGRSLLLREGRDLALIATGNMLATAAQVARVLGDRGVSCRVISMPVVKPLDEEAVERAARECGLLVTLEEHSAMGGLGGAVAELVSELPESARLLRFGAPDSF